MVSCGSVCAPIFNSTNEQIYHFEFYNNVISVPPSLIPIANQEVSKGKSYNIPCLGNGSPTPSVEWSRDGKVLPAGQQVHCLANFSEILNFLR